MPIREARARWEGNLKNGKGTLHAGNSIEARYSFASRFESAGGTNPEELIGAAHAGCFSMALTKLLGDAGHEPKSVETTARVMLEKVGAGFEINRIELRTRAQVPGLADDEFQRLAEDAKRNCVVSKALASVDIQLEAELAG